MIPLFNQQFLSIKTQFKAVSGENIDMVCFADLLSTIYSLYFRRVTKGSSFVRRFKLLPPPKLCTQKCPSRCLPRNTFAISPSNSILIYLLQPFAIKTRALRTKSSSVCEKNESGEVGRVCSESVTSATVLIFAVDYYIDQLQDTKSAS